MRGKKTGGRRKGSPNKTTTSVRDALVRAFDQRGGVPALLEWADASPDEFYRLWGRMLPTDVKIDASDETLTTLLALLKQ